MEFGDPAVGYRCAFSIILKDEGNKTPHTPFLIDTSIPVTSVSQFPDSAQSLHCSIFQTSLPALEPVRLKSVNRYSLPASFISASQKEEWLQAYPPGILVSILLFLVYKYRSGDSCILKSQAILYSSKLNYLQSSNKDQGTWNTLKTLPKGCPGISDSAVQSWHCLPRQKSYLRRLCQLPLQGQMSSTWLGQAVTACHSHQDKGAGRFTIRQNS